MQRNYRLSPGPWVMQREPAHLTGTRTIEYWVYADADPTYKLVAIFSGPNAKHHARLLIAARAARKED